MLVCVMCLGVLTSSQIQPQSLPLWTPSVCLYVWCAQESSPVNFLSNPTPWQGGALKPSGGGASLHPDQKSPIWNIKHSFGGFTFSRRILIDKLNCRKGFHLKQNYSSRELRVKAPLHWFPSNFTSTSVSLTLCQFAAGKVGNWSMIKLFIWGAPEKGIEAWLISVKLYVCIGVWRFAG